MTTSNQADCGRDCLGKGLLTSEGGVGGRDHRDRFLAGGARGLPGAGLCGEGSVGGFRHVVGALHPVGDGRPGMFACGFDEIAQLHVLPNWDGEANAHRAADGDESVGVETAVGSHGEWSAGSSVTHSAHRFLQEVCGESSRVARPLRSRTISSRIAAVNR